jgi:hypothetical protein
MLIQLPEIPFPREARHEDGVVVNEVKRLSSIIGFSYNHTDNMTAEVDNVFANIDAYRKRQNKGQ